MLNTINGNNTKNNKFKKSVLVFTLAGLVGCLSDNDNKGNIENVNPNEIPEVVSGKVELGKVGYASVIIEHQSNVIDVVNTDDNGNFIINIPQIKEKMDILGIEQDQEFKIYTEGGITQNGYEQAISINGNLKTISNIENIENSTISKYSTLISDIIYVNNSSLNYSLNYDRDYVKNRIKIILDRLGFVRNQNSLVGVENNINIQELAQYLGYKDIITNGNDTDIKDVHNNINKNTNLVDCKYENGYVYLEQFSDLGKVFYKFDFTGNWEEYNGPIDISILNSSNLYFKEYFNTGNDSKIGFLDIEKTKMLGKVCKGNFHGYLKNNAENVNLRDLFRDLFDDDSEKSVNEEKDTEDDDLKDLLDDLFDDLFDDLEEVDIKDLFRDLFGDSSIK